MALRLVEAVGSGQASVKLASDLGRCIGSEVLGLVSLNEKWLMRYFCFSLLLQCVFYAFCIWQRSKNGMKTIRERDFHHRAQKHDLALQVPISYVSLPVATESGRDIVEWPVLDPCDFVLCLQLVIAWLHFHFLFLS